MKVIFDAFLVVDSWDKSVGEREGVSLATEYRLDECVAVIYIEGKDKIIHITIHNN